MSFNALQTSNEIILTTGSESTINEYLKRSPDLIKNEFIYEEPKISINDNNHKEKDRNDNQIKSMDDIKKIEDEQKKKMDNERKKKIQQEKLKKIEFLEEQTRLKESKDFGISADNNNKMISKQGEIMSNISKLSQANEFSSSINEVIMKKKIENSSEELKNSNKDIEISEMIKQALKNRSSRMTSIIEQSKEKDFFSNEVNNNNNNKHELNNLFVSNSNFNNRFSLGNLHENSYKNIEERNEISRPMHEIYKTVQISEVNPSTIMTQQDYNNNTHEATLEIKQYYEVENENNNDDDAHDTADFGCPNEEESEIEPDFNLNKPIFPIEDNDLDKNSISKNLFDEYKNNSTVIKSVNNQNFLQSTSTNSQKLTGPNASINIQQLNSSEMSSRNNSIQDILKGSHSNSKPDSVQELEYEQKQMMGLNDCFNIQMAESSKYVSKIIIEKNDPKYSFSSENSLKFLTPNLIPQKDDLKKDFYIKRSTGSSNFKSFDAGYDYSELRINPNERSDIEINKQSWKMLLNEDKIRQQENIIKDNSKSSYFNNINFNSTKNTEKNDMKTAEKSENSLIMLELNSHLQRYEQEKKNNQKEKEATNFRIRQQIFNQLCGSEKKIHDQSKDQCIYEESNIQNNQNFINSPLKFSQQFQQGNDSKLYSTNNDNQNTIKNESSSSMNNEFTYLQTQSTIKNESRLSLTTDLFREKDTLIKDLEIQNKCGISMKTIIEEKKTDNMRSSNNNISTNMYNQMNELTNQAEYYFIPGKNSGNIFSRESTEDHEEQIGFNTTLLNDSNKSQNSMQYNQELSKNKLVSNNLSPLKINRNRSGASLSPNHTLKDETNRKSIQKPKIKIGHFNGNDHDHDSRQELEKDIVPKNDNLESMTKNIIKDSYCSQFDTTEKNFELPYREGNDSPFLENDDEEHEIFQEMSMKSDMMNLLPRELLTSESFNIQSERKIDNQDIKSNSTENDEKVKALRRKELGQKGTLDNNSQIFAHGMFDSRLDSNGIEKEKTVLIFDNFENEEDKAKKMKFFEKKIRKMQSNLDKHNAKKRNISANKYVDNDHLNSLNFNSSKRQITKKKSNSVLASPRLERTSYIKEKEKEKERRREQEKEKERYSPEKPEKKLITIDRSIEKKSKKYILHSPQNEKADRLDEEKYSINNFRTRNSNNSKVLNSYIIENKSNKSAKNISYNKSSNFQLIKNAIQNVCLAGEPNRKDREALLAKIDEIKKDFNLIILFKGLTGRQDFRALYTFDPNTFEVKRIIAFFNSPAILDPSMIHSYYRYDSGAKEFKLIPLNKNFSLAIDAVAVYPNILKGLNTSNYTMQKILQNKFTNYDR